MTMPEAKRSQFTLRHGTLVVHRVRTSDLFVTVIFRAGTVNCHALGIVNYDVILIEKGGPAISITAFLTNQIRGL